MSESTPAVRPLEALTREHDAATARRPKTVKWYRTRLDPAVMKALHRRSDLLGGCQSLGYLGILCATGGLAFFSAGHWPVAVTVLLIFLHGTVYAFLINAVHELGHGTVFKTRALNALFDRVFSFLGWINFHRFEASHAQHHRYTLHPPDDLEVTLPMRMVVMDFLKQGFVNPQGFRRTLKDTIRMARGRFEGEWELSLFPESDPVARRAPVRWARTLLVGHGLILVVSLALGFWMVPILVTFAPFYGGLLFLSCNSTQHIGLADNVDDFRLCCRTFTVNPLVRFLYWHMNYHTEHHMYAAVPCYRLGALHRAIRHDLPPTPHGIVATWREIAMIQKQQEADPQYQHLPRLPQAEPA